MMQLKKVKARIRELSKRIEKYNQNLDIKTLASRNRAVPRILEELRQRLRELAELANQHGKFKEEAMALANL